MAIEDEPPVEETVIVEEIESNEENVVAEDPASTDETSDELAEENYFDINQLIFEDLLLSQGWALGTLDRDGNPTNNGTSSPVFSFSLYIDNITYLGDKLRVSVFTDFEQLSDDDKTYVINSVQGMSSVYTNDIPYTTIRLNGDVIGHSKVTDSKSFKWD